MIILRKIFSNRTSLLRPLIDIRLKCNFSGMKIEKKKIEEVYTQLLTSSSKFKPDVMIKLLNFVHFKSLDLQPESIIKPDQLQRILNTLNVVSLSHSSLVLLLQSISQFDNFAKYNRENQILRLIYKSIYSIRQRKLEKIYYFRLLNILQKMQFPTKLIIKYVHQVIKDIQNSRLIEQNIEKMSRLECIKFYITILEMKFIPILYVDQFYERQIKNVRFQKPKELALLYYSYKSLQKALRQKIVQSEKRIDFKQMVMNPFSSISDSEHPEENKEANPSMSDKQKEMIVKMCEQFKQKVKNQISIEKLKQQLSKYYSFEKEPLDTSTALILMDIQQIIPDICEYLKKNYTKMQPFQFGGLISSVPQNQRGKYYQQYRNKIWKLLSLSQKIYMLRIKAQRCRQSITKEQILSIINESEQISLKQYQKLSIIIVKYIRSQDHLQLIKAIQTIIDRNSTEKEIA